MKGPSRIDAITETRVRVLEINVNDLIDVFEDNVEMGMDFLAWLSKAALALIESTSGSGPELLEFFTGSSV